MRSLIITLRTLAIALFALTMLSGCPDPMVPSPFCGDGTCGNGERGWCSDCPSGYCGDGVCQASDRAGCPDCGGYDPYCGDGICDMNEIGTCDDDCLRTYCGDGVCTSAERGYCDADCGRNSCGDGRCEPEELGSCDADCGYCGDLPPSSNNVQLAMPVLGQWCSQWCWAATITSVANYYGIGATECGLASWYLGDSTFSACCQYSACAYVQCNHTVQTYEMTYFLSQLGLRGIDWSGTIDETTLATEISNGRPVIVGFQGATTGHVAVITGYSPGQPSTFTLDDPWPFDGAGGTRFQLTYAQLALGGGPDGQSAWSHTWLGLALRNDGCNDMFDPSCGCAAAAR